MNSLDTEFHRRIAKRLEVAASEEMQALASGALDHLDYKRVCGRLKAIQDVAEWCDEIETAMNEGK